MKLRIFTLFLVTLACLSPVACSQGDEVAGIDPTLATYKTQSGISGNLSSIGSDTLNNLMAFWTEAFKRHYPGVNTQVEGKGSTTAPPALTEGLCQLGPMSRAMKPSEIDAFEKKRGYKPTQIRVAIDALAVYVHKDNPLEKLTLPQVDAIFSKTRAGGFPNDITSWSQLGLAGEWAERRISLYGRNSASGTYGYFNEHALYKGDYKDTVKEQPGSASVVQGIAKDLSGIGYSGIGYKTSDVKTVALAAKDGAPFVAADVEGVISGKYPLSRFLYIYIDREPGRPVDPLVLEFLKLVLSQEGQQIVVKDGYVALPGKIAAEELKKLM